jgi:hypothetical protein
MGAGVSGPRVVQAHVPQRKRFNFTLAVGGYALAAVLLALAIHFFMLRSHHYSWILPVNQTVQGAAVNPSAPRQ